MTVSSVIRPSTAAPAPTHWLSLAATRAGFAGAADVPIPRTASITNAWDVLARALGVTMRELADRLAPVLGVTVADLGTIEQRSLRLVPEKLAKRYNVIPLAENDHCVFVATANPNDFDAEQAVGFAAGRRVILKLAPPLAIGEAIEASYAPDRSVEHLLSSVGDEFSDVVRVLEDLAPEAVAEEEVQAGPVVKLTNLILRDAVVTGASDAHIEPGSKSGVVRFRIDGVLRTQMQLPTAALNRVVSRIKVLSKLDIADRMRPQDGRARIEVEGKAYDLRVSTVPTRDAEKAVIRVLRPDATRGLDECGMSLSELGRLRQLLRHREGIVIVTGPTGSGKTTTLYSAIKEVATGDVNVMTVEDPIEYELAGITQMQVEPKRNVTFASALRAILRQDPDIIFVGEIRDAETAQVAAQASLTGHLVLATLHTNDAMSAVSRLVDLGLDSATIAASLKGTIAQRLVRRVCPECSLPVVATQTDDETRLGTAFGTAARVRAVGCKACANTGYRGRLPVNEVAVITPAIAEMIATGATAQSLQLAATAAGMRPMFDVAIERAAAGETTLREIERVLGNPTETTADATAQRPDMFAGTAEHEADDEAAQARTEIRPSVATRDAKPAAAARVLVVDDDAVVRFLAVAALTTAGYVVEGAEDGDVALQRFGAGERFDLVITDLHMARVGGAQLLEILRHSPDTTRLPVIVLTGSADQASEVALMDAGADDYLRKPIDPPRLIARAKAVLRRNAL